MSQSIIVSASILCANFARLEEEIKKCEKAGVDMLHIDVMDGHFVPNLTIGAVIVEAMRPVTKLPLDVHLMIEHPWDYIEDYIRAGADIISVHAECYGERRESCERYGQYPKEVDQVDERLLRADILKIKEAGKKAFVVINPGTPLCFDGILKDLDGVLLMSVNPGFAKQKFIADVLPKIKQLRSRFQGLISVDGGINAQTAPDCVKAGANMFATASYFFGAPDQKLAVQTLKNL